MKRPVRTGELNPRSLALMGVPKRFQRVTLDDFKEYGSPSLSTVKEFFRDYLFDLDENVTSGAGVCLMGSNGVGKSMLSCIVLIEAYRRRYKSRRATLTEVINAYASGWDAQSLDNEKYPDLKSAEFLVLEEVGKEFDNRLSSRVLEDLLRYREEQCLCTFICTNMTPENLSAKYGASIASLINGNMTQIEIEEVDRRSVS